MQSPVQYVQCPVCENKGELRTVEARVTEFAGYTEEGLPYYERSAPIELSEFQCRHCGYRERESLASAY